MNVAVLARTYLKQSISLDTWPKVEQINASLVRGRKWRYSGGVPMAPSVVLAGFVLG